MIPEEFEDARFNNYIQETETQKYLYNGITNYLKNFEQIKDTKKNSLIFLAKVGEMIIKSVPLSERARMKAQHNSYGLGKTHLQAAAGKHLIKKGYKVLMISDKPFMDQLMEAKRADDNGAETNRILQEVLNVDVLIWDDIGKSNLTEAKESMYYYIINEYYRYRKVIIASSNEDENTLGEKIGYAAADRLLGMCLDHIYAVEGESWRLKGA